MNQKIVNVLQGEQKVSSDENVVFSTILGSCVAVCLFDPGVKVGGMNHFLLPGKVGESSNSNRYGVNSMELLINAMLRAGASRENLTAKVFGGGAMSEKLREIGEENGKFAKSFLEAEGIEYTKTSLGGNLARRIKFIPSNGSVKQLLVPKENAPVESIEKVSTVSAPARDEITLF